MKLVPIYEKESERGSITAIVLYVIAALVCYVVFRFSFGLAKQILQLGDIDAILISVASALLPGALLIALGNIVNDIHITKWNTAGYYIEYDETDQGQQEDADIHQQTNDGA